ncbi:hypothetical protein K470DRAFT_286250 [Piedraia hortae CBS 480.64]|uniref:Uncharacterized protein n=1 Tax=Piedraia hortae CBS 480.64 TaxID=1314780 RepID=A0A6A7C0E8_9PEZI|nr:hypothetical protein K470DRAFT_286250 [Piedraia hortae CBS 480.64]
MTTSAVLKGLRKCPIFSEARNNVVTPSSRLSQRTVKTFIVMPSSPGAMFPLLPMVTCPTSAAVISESRGIDRQGTDGVSHAGTSSGADIRSRVLDLEERTIFSWSGCTELTVLYWRVTRLALGLTPASYLPEVLCSVAISICLVRNCCLERLTAARKAILPSIVLSSSRPQQCVVVH